MALEVEGQVVNRYVCMTRKPNRGKPRNLLLIFIDLIEVMVLYPLVICDEYYTLARP